MGHQYQYVPDCAAFLNAPSSHDRRRRRSGRTEHGRPAGRPSETRVGDLRGRRLHRVVSDVLSGRTRRLGAGNSYSRRPSRRRQPVVVPPRITIPFSARERQWGRWGESRFRARPVRVIPNARFLCAFSLFPWAQGRRARRPLIRVWRRSQGIGRQGDGLKGAHRFTVGGIISRSTSSRW